MEWDVFRVENLSMMFVERFSTLAPEDNKITRLVP